jgi:antitoxin component YwqK of YwqJK toxin-antitoxin module
VIDSLDHSKRYKIWEQTYSNDKLNGQWKTHTLRGTQANFQTFRNDSLDGITRNFWIDGKTIMEENEYSNGRNEHIHRLFFDNGKIKAEVPYKDDSIDGIRKKYYESGALQEVAEFTKGHFDGVKRYYYPNGQIWIEQIYRAGKSWTVVADYTDKGQKRDPGTLRDGNGTLILYNEDGTVRETTTFVDGEERSSQ